MQFAGLDMDAVPGWFDITADLEPGSPPTLAKADGIGALQFSFAEYAGGKEPRITTTTLKSLLRDFQNREGLPKPKQAAETDRSASATFQGEDQLLQVWFLSNGSSVVIITYLVVLPARGDLERELDEVSRIVGSIEIP